MTEIDNASHYGKLIKAVIAFRGKEDPNETGFGFKIGHGSICAGTN